MQSSVKVKQIRDGAGKVLLEVRITKDHDRVIDVELLINEGQRYEFMAHFEDKLVDYTTGCYTYLLQNHIARYYEWRHCKGMARDSRDLYFDKITLLHQQSEFFASLEARINNHSLISPADDLLKLQQVIEKYRDDLNLPGAAELQLEMDEFLQRIDKLLQRGVTAEEVREILCLQPNHFNHLSLGQFICQQQSHLIDYCMSDIRAQLSGGEKFKQLFHMHPAMKALSDAKADFEKKGESLYGVRTNNTRSPIPAEMLRSLQRPTVGLEDRKKWFSMQPYLENLDNVEQVENALSWFVGRTNEDYGIHGGWKVATFVASLLELVVITLHFAVSLATIWIPFDDFRKEVNEAAARLHQRFSPVAYVKKKANENHILSNDKNAAVVAELQGEPVSYFNVIIVQYATADVLREYFSGVFTKFWGNIKTIVQDGYHVFQTFGHKERLQQEAVDDTYHRLEDAEEGVRREIIEKLQPATVPQEDEPASEVVAEQASIAPCWDAMQLWPANVFTSIFDFPDEVMVALSDVVVDPMFRKSPALATIFFFIAMSSFSVTLLPDSLAAKLGVLGQSLEAMSLAVSKAFTGKGLATFQAKIVSTFLQWKIGFFASEALVESSNGDFEFLKRMFAEPEKITLALIVLISVGVALNFLPVLSTDISINGLHIPNPVAGVINFFAIEAHECANGIIPLNSIEYAFLGLKSALLLNALSSGSYDAAKEGLNVPQLIADYRKNRVLEQPTVEAKEEAIRVVLQQHQISNPDLVQQLAGLEIRGPEAIAEVLFPRPEEVKLTSEDPLVLAGQALQRSINMVARMNRVGMFFESHFQAKRVYDRLEIEFASYNQALAEKGRFDLQIDSDQFLDVFFNKYCYSGSSTVVKMISIVPLYPLTCLWRALKYGLACHTEAFHSPAIAHQVRRSFAKEGAYLVQLFAITGRVLRAFGRSLRNIFHLDFHKINLTFPFRGIYAEWTRAVGMASDIGEQVQRVNQALAVSAKADTLRSQQEIKLSALAEYYKTSQPRPKSLELQKLERIVREVVSSGSDDTVPQSVGELSPGKLSKCCATIFSSKHVDGAALSVSEPVVRDPISFS